MMLGLFYIYYIGWMPLYWEFVIIVGVLAIVVASSVALKPNGLYSILLYKLSGCTVSSSATSWCSNL